MSVVQGTAVPKSDFYIVRPSINFLGMGISSRIEWIEKYTDMYHPGEFWCEIFKGEHLSVDFQNEKSKLVIKGTKSDDSPLYKWEKIDRKVKFPKILKKLKGDYEWINCEFIDGHLIEVHFRRNPDFKYGNSIAIPVWENEEVKEHENLYFIADSEYKRKGFYVK